MTHGSLFSGIGGFDLAAQWAGIRNLFQVEIDEFCLQVLEKNFPESQRFKDIKEFDGTQYKGKIDIISGGFPCQPFSLAGKRKGKEDDRFLWAEMLRVISEIQPTWVIAENVYGLVSIDNGMVFEQVLADLENIGYETQAFIIPACAKNAPHRRDRVWIIGNLQSSPFADTKNDRDRDERPNVSRSEQSEQIREGMGSEYSDSDSNVADANNFRIRFSDRQGQEPITRSRWQSNWYEVATSLCGVDDGLPRRLDRLKSLGNAIVPQVAYEIFKNIQQVNKVC